MRKPTSQGCPLEPGQISELAHVLSKGIVPAGISRQQGQRWIGKPKETADVMAAMLPLDPVEALRRLQTTPTTAVWKTIRIGVHPSAEVLRKRLRSSGCTIEEFASVILKKVIVASEPSVIELIRATVAELGFPEGAPRPQIYEAGLNLGWQLCPNEVGPQLQLQSPISEDGWDLIAMEPISDFMGYPRVFCVEKFRRSLLLQGRHCNTSYLWHGSTSWVFCRSSIPLGS